MVTNKELVEQAVAAIPLWQAFLNQKEAEQDAILAEMQDEDTQYAPKSFTQKLTDRFKTAEKTIPEPPSPVISEPPSPVISEPPELLTVSEDDLETPVYDKDDPLNSVTESKEVKEEEVETNNEFKNLF